MLYLDHNFSITINNVVWKVSFLGLEQRLITITTNHSFDICNSSKTPSPKHAKTDCKKSRYFHKKKCKKNTTMRYMYIQISFPCLIWVECHSNSRYSGTLRASLLPKDSVGSTNKNVLVFITRFLSQRVPPQTKPLAQFQIQTLTIPKSSGDNNKYADNQTHTSWHNNLN